MKKVVTVLIATVIAVKLLLVDSYALSAAPIFGEVLVELFGGLLVSSGSYTTEEVSDMSWNECKNAIDSGLASGTIKPLEVTGNVTLLTPDGSETTVQANYMEWVDYLTNPDTEVVASDLVIGNTPFDKLKNAIDDIVNYGIPATEVKANWVAGLKSSDVRNVRKVDTKGYGAVVTNYYVPQKYIESKYYADYFIINQYGSAFGYSESGYFIVEHYDKNGNLTSTSELKSGKSFNAVTNEYWLASFYGDVRREDGSAAETESTEIAEVGENEEGEKVTLDDIQSGSQRLEDTKLDYDSFNDEAIIDLLNKILAELDKAPVVEDTADNTIAEDFAQELEGSVALEVEDLNSLTLPTGIATVFPFCLPFDFAYGLELLAAKPVAPKFEIPFEIPAFGLYPGTKDVIILDMSEYSKYFEVGRWVQMVIFSIGLCFISFKIVKGVH